MSSNLRPGIYYSPVSDTIVHVIDVSSPLSGRITLLWSGGLALLNRRNFKLKFQFVYIGSI